jgi:hypothetical protein
MTLVRAARLLLVPTLLALVLVACGGGDDDSAPRGTAGSGTPALGAGELPDGWPAEIELPSGAQIQGSSTLDNGAGDDYNVTAETELPLDELVQHFRGELDGWKEEGAPEVDGDDGPSAFLSWRRSGRIFTLVASDAGPVRTFVATITSDSAP